MVSVELCSTKDAGSRPANACGAAPLEEWGCNPRKVPVRLCLTQGRGARPTDSCGASPLYGCGLCPLDGCGLRPHYLKYSHTASARARAKRASSASFASHSNSEGQHTNPHSTIVEGQNVPRQM